MLSPADVFPWWCLHCCEHMVFYCVFCLHSHLPLLPQSISLGTYFSLSVDCIGCTCCWCLWFWGKQQTWVGISKNFLENQSSEIIRRFTETLNSSASTAFKRGVLHFPLHFICVLIFLFISLGVLLLQCTFHMGYSSYNNIQFLFLSFQRKNGELGSTHMDLSFALSCMKRMFECAAINPSK